MHLYEEKVTVDIWQSTATCVTKNHDTGHCGWHSCDALKPYKKLCVHSTLFLLHN